MPTARQLLDILTHNELLQLVVHYGVSVRDRRQKALLVEQSEAQASPSPSLADYSPQAASSRGSIGGPCSSTPASWATCGSTPAPRRRRRKTVSWLLL